MTPSEAYEYYSSNPNFADGKTAQPPVAGTIPRGAIPYQYPRTDAGQKQAGAELKNPLSVSNEDLEMAKEIFEINCAMCHGETGKGDGRLVTSGKFATEVTPLVDEFVQNKPDGEIFHVITMGSVSGFMGSHSAQIKPDDRWRIVCYIKNKLKTD
ncbi:MAG: c-type cytochrome [Bacteroidales bacterium]|nr:c-type cytochrome [Bacteroidota bacterium]MBL6949182.1 c-type cytochrome [Bacteroidales bacterium]